MRRLECLFFALVIIATSASSAEATVCGYKPLEREQGLAKHIRGGSIIVTGIVREVVERERKEFWLLQSGSWTTTAPPPGERPAGTPDWVWPAVHGENAARLEVQDSWKGPVTKGAVWLSYRIGRSDPGFNEDVFTVIAHGSMRSGYRVDTCDVRRGAPAGEFRDMLERYRSQIAELNRGLDGDTGNIAVLRQLYQVLYENRDFERAYETAAKMTALDPGNLLYQSLGARALLESDAEDTGFAETALATFERILVRSPQHVDASHGRSLALIRLDREEEIEPEARDFSFLHIPSHRHVLYRGKSWINLSGRDLTAASFRRAWVRRLNLSGANLARADFGGAQIWQSDFHGANLAGANFEPSSEPVEGGRPGDLQTVLFFVNFRQANLRGANFAGTSITSISAGTSIGKALFEGARYDCATRWPEGFDPIAAGAVLTEPGC